MNLKSKTLWMGNIGTWMTKSYLSSELNKINIFPTKITLKTTQNKKGCAFLEFPTNQKAEEILNNFNGKQINSLELRFNRVKSFEEKYTLPQIIKFTVK